MAQNGYLSIAVIVIFVAISFQEASAIKCWRCTSDATGGAFCNDQFDSTAATDHQKRWSFVECLSPAQYGYDVSAFLNQRPVCKKAVQLINDNYVISRSCLWEHIDAHKNDCLNSSTPSYIKTAYCETCTTDGCNGAAQYGPIALLIAIPMAVAKIFFL